MTRRRLDISLWVVALASFVLMLLANEDPVVRDYVCSIWCPAAPGGHAAFFNNILYDIAVAFFTGVIFYVLLVRLPARVQRKRIRRGLLKHYSEFREEVVTQLLFASKEPAELSLIESLSDPLAFKDYFDRDNGRRWYAAASAIDNPETSYLDAIQVAVVDLKAEIEFMVDHVELDDETYEFFKRGVLVLARLARTRPEYDDVKSLMRSLYELMTGWSFAGGKAGRDYVREGLERL